MDNFINDCEAFNNTIVRKIAGQVYVDSAKNLEGHTSYGYKLITVYQATREEHIAAMSGSGKMSTFNVNGVIFFGNAYLAVKA